MIQKTTGIAEDETEERDSLENNIVELAITGKLADVGRRAIEAGLAKGIPATFQRGEKIIQRYPDGHEMIVGILPSRGFKFPAGVEIINDQ